MVKKLIFVGMTALAGALPFAVAAPGATREAATCFGSPATITGSGTIEGTMGDDVLVGGDGDDSIHGKGGKDKVCGGGGNDKLGGGPDDDQVDGGAGNDHVDGGLGNDLVLGGEGDDQLACGTGEDVADGGPGTNTAVTTGFEACETVTNANATETVATPKPLAAALTVRHEVPRPTGTRGGAGRFTATSTTTGTGATIAWRLTFTRLSGPAVSAHIHLGGPGKAGPVIAALCSPCRSGASGTATLDGQVARKAVLNGETYVNVHTKRNPAGEIRGQLLRLDR